MRVLIIDNNIMRDSWGSENLRRFARQVVGATVAVRRAPQDDLPRSPREFDRIVVSGSLTSAEEDAPWIDRLLEFIRQSVDGGKPYLGVCFGHQMLARALGGKSTVRKAARTEYGWVRVETIVDSPLFKSLPSQFHSFASHQDEVATLPNGARTIAKSERCSIQSFELKGQPAFGIQFHPEKLMDECVETVKRWRREPNGREILPSVTGPTVFKAEIGETVFRNFFEL